MTGVQALLFAGVLFGVTSATGAEPRKSSPLYLDSLSYPEQVEYLRCRRQIRETSTCTGLADRVCHFPKNVTHPDCIFREYERCKEREFNPSDCTAKLRTYCDTGGDEMEPRCDQLRYEECLPTGFTTPECRKARVNLVIPIIQGARDDRAEASANVPHDVDNASNQQISRMPKILCALADGDSTHPYSAFCHRPVPKPDFVEAERQYRRLKLDPKPWPEKVGKLIQLYSDLLAKPVEESIWEALAAQEIHGIAEMLSTRGRGTEHTRLRLLGLQILARFGGDGLVTNFMLLRASHEAALRKSAIYGLSVRSYPSSFVSAALLQATTDPDPEVRAAAWRGVGHRWNRRATDELSTGTSAFGMTGLIDCRDYPARSEPRPSLESLREVLELDLKDPRHLCRFGEGLELSTLHTELRALFWSKLQAGSTALSEKASILDGLTSMSVYPNDFIPEAHTDATQWLRAESGDLRTAALQYLLKRALILGTESARVEFAETLSPLFQSALRRSTGSTVDPQVIQLLTVFRELGLMNLDLYRNQPKVTRIIANIRDQCVARSTLPWNVRLTCYASVAETIPLRSFADAIRKDAIKHLHLQTGIGSYEKKALALQLLSGKYFSHDTNSSRETRLDCGSIGEISREVLAEAHAIITRREHLHRYAPLLHSFLKSVDALTIESGYARDCPDLRIQHQQFHQSLNSDSTRIAVERWITLNHPRMMFSEYFSRNRTQELIQKQAIMTPEGLTFDFYVETRHLTALLDGELRKRELTDVIIDQFAKRAAEQLYLRLIHSVPTGKADDHDFDRELWGVSLKAPI